MGGSIHLWVPLCPGRPLITLFTMSLFPILCSACLSVHLSLATRPQGAGPRSQSHLNP